MKVLVAGGSGFIGSNLCEFLINRNFKVYCLDNSYSSNIQNIQHLISNPNFEYLEWDVRDPINLSIDQIYNLACPASPVSYQADPVYTLMTNVTGTYNLLQLALKENAVFTQASTSEIYGDPLTSPQKETDWGNVNPIGLRSCYDEGKRAAETLIMDFNRVHRLDVKIARIFNTYGPGMDANDGRVVSNFICQALRGKPITIYGDGTQTRSFCYIDDLLNGLFKLMHLPQQITGPINLGNPEEFQINELAEIILKLTKSSSTIQAKNLPSDDPRKRRPDTQLARRCMDWQTSIQLEDGLQNTIEYFRKNLEHQIGSL